MKLKHKLLLVLAKWIPIVCAIGILLSNTCNYLEVYAVCDILDYNIGVSTISIISMYCMSYAYEFCKWHRIVITYDASCIMISSIVLLFDLDISVIKVLSIFYILFGVTILLLIYEYVKNKSTINK